MSDVKRTPDPASRRPPIALLAFVTLFAVVAGLLLLSLVAQRQNEGESAAEKTHVNAAIGELHTALKRDVARLAAVQDFASGPIDIGVLDQVLLLNRGGVDSISILSGTRAESSDLNRSILDFTRIVSTGAASATEGMVAPGDLFDIVAVTLPAATSPATAGPPAILVGVRQIDSDYVRSIARSASVKGLELIHGVSDTISQRDAWSTGDWRGFGLIWEPARPGDQLMLRWTVIVVAITSIIAVAIILRARREAGRLHASEARAVEASRNDWLSGLPNRVFFNHVLERDLKALKHDDGRLALFYLDVDRFKDINDAFGLEAGDLMIRAVTRRIEAVLGQGQSLARFEGDAFSVLLPGIEDCADCERFAERIQSAMAAPFEVGGTSIALSLSIGIAIAPDDASERTELVRLANLALFRAKREGRNRLAFYKPDLHDEWRRRTSIEHSLRDAISNGGLVMRYQPIVDANTGRMVCAEALVRWMHPTEGLIAPDVFIGLAEDRGLIVPLGEWVLREACAAARLWPGIHIAVNVSPIQFRQKHFVDTAIRIVEESGIEPSRLELELTEGVLVDHEAGALNAMATLRQRGIRLAIDDFGTGYSSLIYLRRFSIDKIKIDRAFIDEVELDGEAAILVNSVVQLGRALGLTVTAEGIETAGQRDFLARIGCHQLQGYLIAKPLTEEELTGFLAREADLIDIATTRAVA